MPDNYALRRQVRRELARLKLDQAERVLVKTCCDCPCFYLWNGEPACTRPAPRCPTSGDAPPPHDCPLRTRSLSIAIDPDV